MAAWHSERPDLDVEPLQVLSRVSRLARHLDRARRAAFTGHGLETWEFDVLSALRRQGAPYQLTPGRAAPGHAGHLGHDDQPGGPAGRGRAWSAGSPIRRTAAACWSR